MAAQTVSTVRAAAFRSRRLSLAMTCSTGFRSGEIWQEEKLGSGGADELAYGFASVAAEIVQDDDIDGRKGRQENLLDIEPEAQPSIGPSMNHGASIRSWRRATSKVAVSQRP
jgi:hypothetical protein